jgi:hypothetical protein
MVLEFQILYVLHTPVLDWYTCFKLDEIATTILYCDLQRNTFLWHYKKPYVVVTLFPYGMYFLNISITFQNTLFLLFRINTLYISPCHLPCFPEKYLSKFWSLPAVSSDSLHYKSHKNVDLTTTSSVYACLTLPHHGIHCQTVWQSRSSELCLLTHQHPNCQP